MGVLRGRGGRGRHDAGQPGRVRAVGDRAADAARRAQPRAERRVVRPHDARAAAARTGRRARSWCTRRPTSRSPARRRRSGVPKVFSNQASWSMEDCAAVMGDSPRWFQLYWRPTRSSSTASSARAEAVGCEAIVVTLDTTMLGWRPQDLDLGSLPFALGKGIAQYTSDPLFWGLVRIAQAGRGRRAVPTATLGARCGRCSRSAASVPGSLLRQPALAPAARRGRDVPGHLLAAVDDLGRRRAACGRARGCRSCSRASCTPTTPAGRPRPGSTASWCPTTAGARSTARSRRSTRWPTWSPRSTDLHRCCSTAASAPARTSSTALALGADAVLIGRPQLRPRARRRRRRPRCRLEHRRRARPHARPQRAHVRADARLRRLEAPLSGSRARRRAGGGPRS